MNFILKIAIVILIVNSKSNGLLIRSLLIADICGEGLKCVYKCCPDSHYVFEDTCVRNDTVASADFSEVQVYNADLESTGRNLYDVFSVVKGGIQEEGTDGEWTNSYLMENGKLLVKSTMPNTPTKSLVFENDEFCVDYVMTEDSKYPKIAFRVTMPPEKDNSVKIKLNIAAFIISSFFLALVLVVYSVFASLRNLVGKIIMSLAASLLGGFVMYATLLLYAIKSEDVLDVGFCRGSYCCIYFFLLASLFWMNVFSYDIWKQFRKKRLRCSYREKRWEDRRKYLVYSMYAWGTPLAMAIMLLMLDLDIIDVTSMPRFIKPNIVENNNNCLLEETETIYYLYIPMLILLLCNWVFYLMTVYAIWRTKRDARSMGVTSTPNNIKQRMMIFLRLSLVMGVNWVLEVLTAIAPDLPIWYITDMYNLLIGVAIFIIAVCNRKVYKLIVKRFSSRSRSQPSFMKNLKSSSQTQDSTLSDEPSNDVQLLSLNKQSTNKEQAH